MADGEPDWFRMYRDSQSLLANARQDLLLSQSAHAVEREGRLRAEAEMVRLKAEIERLEAKLEASRLDAEAAKKHAERP